MTTSLRSVPSLLLIALVALVVLTVLPAAEAAGTTAKPEPGPLSPAFVEALHDPLVSIGLGRLPSPVEVHVGAAAEARAARMAEPSSYSLIDEGRVTPVKDQGSESTCWAFANIAALESRLMPADPAPDLSEDNLVGRDGYGPFPDPYDTYSYGGYDFMAVAYFARWAGPLLETDDPYPTRSRPATGPVQDHVQGVVMIPGRATATDNDLIKRLVRENGALSVGMYWDSSAFSEVTDVAGYHATYYLDRRWGENHGVTIVGWDDAYPGRQVPGRRRSSAGGRRLPRAQHLGRRAGAKTAPSGSPTTTSRSPATRDSAATAARPPTRSSKTPPTTLAPTSTTSSASPTTGASTARGCGAPTGSPPRRRRSSPPPGFYALSSSTRYEVWAGRTLRSLRLRASGTVELPGYTTVPLSTTLSVYAGQALRGRRQAGLTRRDPSHGRRAPGAAPGCRGPRPRPVRAT